MKREKSNFKNFIIIIIFILLITLLFARYFETKGLKVYENAIISENLPQSFNGLKIVHLSDIHYGKTTDIKDIKKLVKKINSLKPDIIVFTGDLYDKSIVIPKDDIEIIEKELKNLEANLYKYAVIGDSDQLYYNDYQTVMDNADFILLNNSNDLLYYKGNTPIKIVGLTDGNELPEAFKTDLEEDVFTIALFHKSDLFESLNDYQVNVAFSGHSLGGQIRIPFIGGIIKRDGSKKYVERYYQVDNKEFYISSGIGTEDVPFRLFNKPSINFYRIYSK